MFANMSYEHEGDIDIVNVVVVSPQVNFIVVIFFSLDLNLIVYQEKSKYIYSSILCIDVFNKLLSPS
jgi:hypothetical protein